ncbi:MAG: Metal dependent phosphohydrolase [Parcubacteria group bacterium GW2011_GWF2_38_76]|nr:MAG: Metal dependent phosphohydrolase [Parcubacteria group bacterium GW2011_GWF2_38_76]HBM45450.1 hypothetical protein [Patescibacteria group bacterium]
MPIRELILKKISEYQPKNGLDYIARFFISMASVRHGKVTGHIERVALLSEVVAKRLKMDAKAAFFAGLLHDVGKIILPYYLFDGHNINQEEYEEVKKHAILGSEALKCDYLFTGLCAGLHHAMYQKGYGLTVKDFPESLSPATIKKVLQISAIVSISDFIEAFTHRTTKIKDGSDKTGDDLKSMLYAKYLDDIQLVEEFPKIEFWS